jgi:hypothetical protein
MARIDLIRIGRQIKLARAIRWLESIEHSEMDNHMAAINTLRRMARTEYRTPESGRGQRRFVRWGL